MREFSKRRVQLGQGGVMAPGANISRPPQLVIIGGGPSRGRVLVLNSARQVVGRLQTSDLWLADADVSRTHAALDRSSGHTILRDLGSSSGTMVNGHAVASPRMLRHGDIVQFGSVEARYEEPQGFAAETMITPVAPSPRTGPRGSDASPRVDFRMDRQDADVINNVGRDQHNQFNQYNQQRESFLASIAATKTRASRLVVVGFLMIVGGGGVYAWAILRTLRDMSTDQTSFQAGEFFGPPVHGIPIGLIGFGVGFVGQFVLIAGIVLHIVAAARRRQLNNQMPPPGSPSWVRG